jgi:hypothetical protein
MADRRLDFDVREMKKRTGGRRTSPELSGDRRRSSVPSALCLLRGGINGGSAECSSHQLCNLTRTHVSVTQRDIKSRSPHECLVVAEVVADLANGVAFFNGFVKGRR